MCAFQSLVNERRKKEQVQVAVSEYDPEQAVVREIIDELVEKICYGQYRVHCERVAGDLTGFV